MSQPSYIKGQRVLTPLGAGTVECFETFIENGMRAIHCRVVVNLDDGSRWAAGFQLSDEEYVIVVDGKEVGRGQGSPRKVVFSPDGSRVGWLEKQKNSWKAYLDGQAGPEFREIYSDEPPQFSPDGKAFVYFARDNEKKMHIVVFGGEDRAHDITPPRAAFAKGGVEYLAIDGKRFRRDVIPLP